MTVATVQGQQKTQQALRASLQAARQGLTRQIESKQARAQTLFAEREALRQRQEVLQARSQEFSTHLSQFTNQIESIEKQVTEPAARQAKLEQTENSAAPLAAA
ncbi:MAG: hypothetical protein U0401_29335 [Anaerolineae bacterium]